MSEKIEFKPRARLLLQLGDQLIKSDSIALLEIVKNAYDANATHARVYMKNLEDPEKGQIVIEDDGDGMNLDIIRDVWMQPGSEHKEKLLARRKPKDKGRPPIGGKGIGRFGVHKLGYKIQLISKMEGGKEVSLKVDWRDFEQDKFLSDIKIELLEHDSPTHFTGNKTGTKIIVHELKNKWTRGSVRDLYRAVNSLNSPFETKDSFNTYFVLDNQDWLQGLKNFKEFKEYALYYAEATLKGNEITKLKYDFRPWDTMSKLTGRSETYNNIRIVERQVNETSKKKEMVDVDLSNYEIGEVKIKFLIFDLSPKVLSLGVSDKKGLREYLNTNGGVRVFRDNIRVYDYGEPENDWLNLDIARVNQPGSKISNNQIIGAILLNRSESKDLIEKTNREGFIENEAYLKFTSSVLFTIGKVLTQRNLDKDLVRKYYGTSASNEPVLSQIKIIQEKINEGVKDQDLKTDLLKSISKIEKDYESIAKIYMRSSSAGLSLSIVIHEIIHMISELASAIEKQPTDPHVKQLVRMLQRTAGDYADVIKQSNKNRVDLITVTRHALSTIKFRIKAHDVEIIDQYLERKNLNTTISCAKNLVTSTIINLVDNSIWWQQYARVKNKRILVDIVEYPEKHISLLIADNGPGFSIPPEQAVKPFISDKDGGMGLGLHLADEVMKGQKGQLIFPEPYDFDMPEEFQNGAKLLLSFRKML
ncbi:sensor histidine kinase [Kangiella sp. M94]